MCVLTITMLLVMPTDAQATKKTKKKPKATIEEDYQSPDNNYLIGQKGVLKKFPEKLDVKRVIKNRNKKAKYTFYAADKKKLTISQISELLKNASNSAQGERTWNVLTEKCNYHSRRFLLQR